MRNEHGAMNRIRGTRIALVVLCILLALAAGMMAAAGVHGADSPGALSRQAWLWDFALSAGFPKARSRTGDGVTTG